MPDASRQEADTKSAFFISSLSHTIPPIPNRIPSLSHTITPFYDAIPSFHDTILPPFTTQLHRSTT